MKLRQIVSILFHENGLKQTSLEIIDWKCSLVTFKFYFTICPNSSKELETYSIQSSRDKIRKKIIWSQWEEFNFKKYISIFWNQFCTENWSNVDFGSGWNLNAANLKSGLYYVQIVHIMSLWHYTDSRNFARQLLLDGSKWNVALTTEHNGTILHSE